ncbi:MAG: prephenate dehydratase [Planctomycetia bacterium]|nr:prephenate dehydratase [Planctomycetia bacterium]
MKGEWILMQEQKSRESGELEKLDAQIVEFIRQRAQKVCEENGVKPVPIKKAVLETICRDISSACDELVVPRRVAFLGPFYSYSHLALMDYFGVGVSLSPVTTISAVFEEIERKQADFGVVPMENSTDGGVVDALESFVRHPVKICGEVRIPIHHSLAAKCSRAEITEVHSKPQVLSQCRHWLNRHLPGVRVVEAPSSADAAKRAASKKGVAAITSEMGAKAYHLKVLEKAVEDNPNNCTRFVVLGNVETRKTGRDKTTLILELPHQPGALADAMMVFKKKHLNLTWIESFPAPGTFSTYLFFVDFEGHESELKVRRALTMLQSKACRVSVLGSYARSKD